MTAKGKIPSRRAVMVKGFLSAHRWLILRRLSQFGFLALFLAGPLFGLWIVKGTLSSSVTLGVLKLSDPYMVAQSLAAGHAVASSALIGAAIVMAAYAVIGGRVYCSWVCPINIVTDAASWLRERLGLPKGWQPPAHTRLWLLAATILVSALTGAMVWEFVNPVSMLYRGLIFGLGMAWSIVFAVFLFDLFVSRRGWCGHLCPVGAAYGLLGGMAPLRMRADNRAACDHCLDCYAVCPEPRVITPALTGPVPVILSRDCTNCGRCADVCGKSVFTFGAHFPGRKAAP